MAEDDPKSPAPAPEGAPAGDQAAETEPREGEEPESGDAETEAAADDEQAGDEQQDDDDEEADDDDEEGGDKPRKSSRATRYRREAEALKAQLAELRSRSNLPSDQAALEREFQRRVSEEIGPPPDQNDPRFKDNYVAFERETQAWLNDARTVSREVRKDIAAHLRRDQEHVSELASAHKERIARLKTKVKDFDQVVARATVPVAPHVERLILESKRSDRLTYHLAKDQTKLAALNRMSNEAAAREIGRIEGRLSLPPPKQQTQARKPIAPLKGGGAGPKSQLQEVDAYMKKLYGPRA